MNRILPKLTVKYWSDKLYPAPHQRDPVITFLQHVQKYVKDDSVILDLGAGAGELNKYNFKGGKRKIFGIDLDRRVGSNQTLDFGVIGDGNALPFKDKSFDLIFCIYVLEHVEKPAAFAAEISRVLKPGGVFMALTPNKFHYVPLIARLTPTWFHKFFNELRGRDSEDTFETFYRLNSERDIRRWFSRGVGFDKAEVEFLEVRPNYLMFCLVSFLVGVGYEKVVNSSNVLKSFRVNLISMVSKQSP